MSQQAYTYLVKILSARDYSEYKLRVKLREKQYPANEIEAAIADIKAKGYLREEVFTESRIRTFMNKGLSVNHIRQKLHQEHLQATDEQIQEIFDENQISEDQQIERLARKKMGSKTDLDFDEQGKILRYLISKGHDYALAKKVLGTLVSELKIEDDCQSNF
jgi:regulatory protein